jgi:tetratricopeptide (TPR) repeat protein
VADAKFAPAYLNLAVVEHQHLGEKSKALAHYQRYLDLTPKAQRRADVPKVVALLSQELAPPKPTAVAVATRPVSAINVATTTTAHARTPAPATTVGTRVTSPAPATTASAPSHGRVIVTNFGPSVVVVPAPSAPIARKKRTPVAVRSLPARDRAKATVYFKNGAQLQSQHNLSGAIAAYTKAVAADPSFATAYYNAAIAYRELGQIGKALDNYELALIADPASTDARRNYAILLEQQGYSDDAIEQYETILRSNPSDAAAHRAVGTIYAHDPATVNKARQHYEAYLRLVPDSPLARDIRRWLDQTH